MVPHAAVNDCVYRGFRIPKGECQSGFFEYQTFIGTHLKVLFLLRTRGQFALRGFELDLDDSVCQGNGTRRVQISRPTRLHTRAISQ